MKHYTYQNNLVGKKQLRQLLAWSFTNYDSMQACYLADELKYLGFKYATQAGISISIEDLKVPFVKNLMLGKSNQEIIHAEKIYLKGKITDVERFQKIIDTWSLTSESLKNQIIYYFKNYDPLNSVYIMAFSGARGNLSQVRQLVGMRGLMSDPSGEIMNLPIKKNFREGLTITDYLMSGYGARKGIVDTALKTANSGYLTRRLIDVAQDILIREKDCLTKHSFFLTHEFDNGSLSIYDKILGRILSKSVFEPLTNGILVQKNTQITFSLIQKFKETNITTFYLRSPLTCNLYRAVCQSCYGWDLANENLVDIGEAIGILAGQSIGEPGTQLTMRTFHTGGIFTSEARQQIISPLNGIIQYYRFLKTVLLRTNRGEDVLVAKNSGSLILIPDDKEKTLVQINILPNTILFPKNNQYVLKDMVIGEVINTNKQIRNELKPIVSNESGEIFIPKLKKKVNISNNNKLLWLLAGQLYMSPRNSFLNFYPDYKLNPQSYIFRTKLLNHHTGFVSFLNKAPSLYQRSIKLINAKYIFKNSKLQKLDKLLELRNFLLNINGLKYLINLHSHQNNYCLQVTQNEQIGRLITNSFRTFTGGTVFYDHFNSLQNFQKDIKDVQINYYSKKSIVIKSLALYRTLIWLGEEIHNVNCEENILLVEHGDVISAGFEIIPGLFSRTSGFVIINQKNQFVKTIFIKSGLVYEGKKLKIPSKKLYYPGEIIFSNIIAKTLSFCEQIVEKKTNQLLVRPINLYEVSNLSRLPLSLKNETSKTFSVQSKIIYIYKSNQRIKGIQNLNLILNALFFKTNKSHTKPLNLLLRNNTTDKLVHFNIAENLSLMNYIPSDLKYKKIQSCFIIQKDQFISKYTVLGYLESITKNFVEIVQFKIKKQDSKKILLIANKDCLVISKSTLAKKKLNQFITDPENVNKSGKIILENDTFFTIQKGRPYFFPNCQNDDSISNINLQYKLISSHRFKPRFQVNQNISLDYRDIFKVLIVKKLNTSLKIKSQLSIKAEFSKLFIKNNGKFYSCLIPRFFKKWNLRKQNEKSGFNSLVKTTKSKNTRFQKQEKTLLVQNSDMLNSKYKNLENKSYELTLIRFVEQPFTKVSKAVGLYSITEDFFEQEINSVFCKNSEFIESGKTLGLLNLEKEITGDIVQGLPRIEEILEARKKNLIVKRIRTSQKKGLLIQKTSLDTNFEFTKLGTCIKENDKINPHKLLKVYFNYYGLIKFFICERTKLIKYSRLIDNYEGSYKSFKKVQSFILNSVQGVYLSQGVTINDKHLEVIIKQMTTKVLITYEGETPLLRREIIDLYHINYINKIALSEKKQIAYYVPLLLGISKAALNNPSFISAASFQETTRVLTTAAIEGRIDWLRGLKENIIIGHLIPTGTGSVTYRDCFKKKKSKTTRFNNSFHFILNNI